MNSLPGTQSKAHFLRYLRRHKLRLTPQREAVVNAVCANAGHFEAETIAAQLRVQQHISRATVYRTLDLLRSCALLEKHDFGAQGMRYEQIPPGAHHDHLICLDCGRVEEFFHTELESLQNRICAEHGFQLSAHRLHMFGRCADCLRRQPAADTQPATDTQPAADTE